MHPPKVRPGRQWGRLGLLLVCAIGAAGCDSPVFEDGFEGDALDRGKWLVDAHDDCELMVTSAMAVDGATSLRIAAPDGRRCEIVPRLHSALMAKFFREPFGEERWYRFSVFIEDAGDQRPVDDLGVNTIVAQWHSSPDSLPQKEAGRGPPLALRIHSGRWGITYGADPRFRSVSQFIARNWHWLGPIETGRWIDWTFRVVWSYGDDGITEVWRDDELVMQRNGPNAFNDLRGVYLKLGLYHPTGDQVLYLDKVSVGNER